MIRVLLRMLCCSGRARASLAHPDPLFSSFDIPPPHMERRSVMQPAGGQQGEPPVRGSVLLSSSFAESVAQPQSYTSARASIRNSGEGWSACRDASGLSGPTGRGGAAELTGPLPSPSLLQGATASPTAATAAGRRRGGACVARATAAGALAPAPASIRRACLPSASCASIQRAGTAPPSLWWQRGCKAQPQPQTSGAGEPLVPATRWAGAPPLAATAARSSALAPACRWPAASPQHAACWPVRQQRCPHRGRQALMAPRCRLATYLAGSRSRTAHRRCQRPESSFCSNRYFHRTSSSSSSVWLPLMKHQAEPRHSALP
jgi:hypothetical protein